MHRYFVLFILLLALDQGAKNLIDAFVPVESYVWVGEGTSFVAGNGHHYPGTDVLPALPIVLGCGSLFLINLIAAWVFSEPKLLGRPDKLFLIAALCFLFEGITQGLDFLLHGYVIDYFGFAVSQPVQYAEVAHVGDYLFRIGVIVELGGFVLSLYGKSQLYYKLMQKKFA